MTAPSLLHELEGVVKFLLGERPLDGRWFGDDPPVTASGMKRHYWWWRTDLRKAYADMAKRMEAAERDAARYRWLKMQSPAGFQYQIIRTPWTLWDASIDAATQEGEG